MKKAKDTNKSLFHKILQLLMEKPALQNIRILFYFYDKVVLHFLKKPQKEYAERKKVIITFPFALGDCVMFLGTAEYLRKIYPPSEFLLYVVCQKGYEQLFDPYFDKILSFEFAKASVNPLYRIKIYRNLRKRYYNIAVDPIGCEECSPNIFVINALCAGEKIGVISSTDKKIQCPNWMRNRIYDRIIFIEEKNLHKIKYYARIWQKLGNIACIAHPAYFSPVDLKMLLPEYYFVVFPSASIPVKQWPVKRFAEIARRVYKQTGYALVVCGTKRDEDTINEFLHEIPEIPVYNYVGQTTVKEFIELIGRSELLVTNDTSTYHIGVAKKIKVCVVTGGYVYDTFINYEYEAQGYRKPAIVCHKKSCYNCYNMCKYEVKGAYPCVEENTVEDAWKAIEKLLDEEG